MYWVHFYLAWRKRSQAARPAMQAPHRPCLGKQLHWPHWGQAMPDAQGKHLYLARRHRGHPRGCKGLPLEGVEHEVRQAVLAGHSDQVGIGDDADLAAGQLACRQRRETPRIDLSGCGEGWRELSSCGR